MIRAEILAYFQRGGKLSTQKAFRMFHTTELRKIVSRLRRAGFPIKANRQHEVKSDGKKVAYNEYYLELCD